MVVIASAAETRFLDAGRPDQNNECPHQFLIAHVLAATAMRTDALLKIMHGARPHD
jgi:hypothetical protein